MALNTTIHPSSQHLAHLVDLFVFQGVPDNLDGDRPIEILVNSGFVVGYSPKRLQPAWAAYRVALAGQDVDYDRPHLYYADQRLDVSVRLGSETFGRLGGIQYHVGHMVPNEVINRQFGRLAQMETFFMSNMSPQRGTLNTGVWLDLENKIRNIEDKSGKDHVWAMIGPVFGDDPRVIERDGGQEVPVPESYFAVLIDPFRYPWNRRGNQDIAALIIPQDAERNTPLDSFLVDVSEVEEATMLKFFTHWVAPGPLGPPQPLAGRERRHRFLAQLM